jgi:hypothetical protein
MCADSPKATRLLDPVRSVGDSLGENDVLRPHGFHS